MREVRKETYSFDSNEIVTIQKTPRELWTVSVEKDGYLTWRHTYTNYQEAKMCVETNFLSEVYYLIKVKNSSMKAIKTREFNGTLVVRNDIPASTFIVWKVFKDITEGDLTKTERTLYNRTCAKRSMDDNSMVAIGMEEAMPSIVRWEKLDQI